MHIKVLSLVAGVLVVTPALADFQVWYGIENTAADPENPGQFADAYFFNNDPDCNDVGKALPFWMPPDGDLSDGGSKCDGCKISQEYDDWDITRFEVYDKDNKIFVGNNSQFRLIAKVNDDGKTYKLVGTKGQSYGSCERGDRKFKCGGWSSKGGFQLLTCKTGITVKNSN